MQFKDFFNAYDTEGTLHTGFLQAMDFSGLTSEVTFLNELTMAMMDAYLFNLFSGSMVMRQWGKYMEYSRENDRLEIFKGFYADFVNALGARLIRSDKFWQLTQTDFTSLSATDIKTIEHGTKETDLEYAQAQRTNVYGQAQKTNVYGIDETTNVYGQQQNTNAYGVAENTKVYGAQSTTKSYDKVVVELTRAQDTHQIGATHTANSSTTTNQIYPLGASAYVDDNKSTVSGTTDGNAQTNTDTWGKQTNETAARTDGESKLTHTDTSTDAAHTDTITSGTHTDTETRAARTDTETDATRTDTTTDAAKTDKQTIKAYTDTERHTKHIILSPEKYFEIEKELADIGIYDLMAEAVKETMILSVWEGNEYEY